MKKKLKVIIGSVVLLIIFGVFVLYYLLGIGFGQAVVKTVKGVKKAREEWEAEGVNPLDSIKNGTIEIIDSIDIVN